MINSRSGAVYFCLECVGESANKIIIWPYCRSDASFSSRPPPPLFNDDDGKRRGGNFSWFSTTSKAFICPFSSVISYTSWSLERLKNYSLTPNLIATPGDGIGRTKSEYSGLLEEIYWKSIGFYLFPALPRLFVLSLLSWKNFSTFIAPWFIYSSSIHFLSSIFRGLWMAPYWLI